MANQQMRRNGGQLAHKQKFQSLRQVLERGKGQLQLAMQRHMDPDRMIRLALTAATRNPTLFECSHESIGLSLLTASQLGIEPNGRDGHLVPYYNSKQRCYEAQFLADFKGLVKLAYRNDRVLSIQASAVRENDEFDYEFGTNAHLRHKPANRDRGELICAWAMVKLRDAEPQFVVLDRDAVLKRKQASQTGRKNVGPWRDWEDEMWAKTAVKVLSKFVPLGGEFEEAVHHDNAAESGETVEAEFTASRQEEQDAPNKSDRLADELGADPDDVGEEFDRQSQAGEQPQDEPAQVGKRTRTDIAREIEGQIRACETAEQVNWVLEDTIPNADVTEKQEQRLRKQARERLDELNRTEPELSLAERFEQRLNDADGAEELRAIDKEMAAAAQKNEITSDELDHLRRVASEVEVGA